MNPESQSNPTTTPATDDPFGGLSPVELLRAAGEGPLPQPGAPSTEEIAAAFPKLEILGLLGQGGMGFVYKARQPDLDRVVALKILRPDLGRDPAFSERFAREARVLAKLNHPNIVTVFEHGQAGRFFYLLMEHVDGVNLRQAMRAGRFTPEQALAIVPGICDALQAAHAQGIWHRDIKPENILLDQEGRVKIVDFGIARIVGDPARDFTLTLTGAALGSAPYMAPEQHERPHEADHRADIYSLGVVFYEMLTGELPLGRFPNPSERAAVHARIDAIVLQTLEKERELRQQSATEVKTDIQRAARDGGSPTAGPAPSRAESWFSRLPSLVRRSLLAWLGGLLLLGSGFWLQEERISGAAFPLSIGAVAAVLGLLGGLWSLFEMRRGWLPAAGRGLLKWTMLVPLLLASAALGPWLGLAVGGLDSVPYLLCIPIAFAATFLLAWPLRHFLLPESGRTRTLVWTSILLLATALAGGKFLQGKWPFIDGRSVEARLAYGANGSGEDKARLENLRKAIGEWHQIIKVAPFEGNGLVQLEWIETSGDPADKARVESVVARLNQLTGALEAPWIFNGLHWIPSRRTGAFELAVVALTGLSSLAAVLLAGCGWRPGLGVAAGALLASALAVATPGLGTGPAGINPMAFNAPLPLFTPDELPREVDFSTPEATARTLVLAARRGQTDILREAVSPAVAAELDKHNEWEIFFQPGKAVNPKNLQGEFSRPDPDRANRRGSHDEGYVRIDGTWKLDTLAYAGDRFRGPFTPRKPVENQQPGQPKPPEQPKQPLVVEPKEDPVATVRLLNRLANEQNAEAFLARKWQGLFSFGGDIPATRYMAPFYGEILQIGVLKQDKGSAKVVVKFKRPDGKEEFREIVLDLQDNEWRLLIENAPEYLAWTLIEFKPPQGNAPAILKNHLGDKPFFPVAGHADRFLIGGVDTSAEEARKDAEYRAEMLEISLKEAGLDPHFRVLAPAVKPTEPWMGGDPVVPEIPALPPANP